MHCFVNVVFMILICLNELSKFSLIVFAFLKVFYDACTNKDVGNKLIVSSDRHNLVMLISLDTYYYTK